MNLRKDHYRVCAARSRVATVHRPGEVERRGVGRGRRPLGPGRVCLGRQPGVGGSESRGNLRPSAPSPRPNSSPFFLVRVEWAFRRATLVADDTTSNGGPLGSCIDEERSELRDVVRVAELASHQFFERKWRRGVSLAARLSERPLVWWSATDRSSVRVGRRAIARPPKCEWRGRDVPSVRSSARSSPKPLRTVRRSDPSPARVARAAPLPDLSSGEITRRI